MPTRLSINKTPKCYVGGAFIRSESGRTFSLRDKKGNFFAHIPQCTRKDLRNAVEAAAKAFSGWSKRTGYNRGQILYRVGEMLEARRLEIAEAIAIASPKENDAHTEVTATIDRLIYYAGWADKYEQLLGSVNAVAAPYFNFTVTEPMGIVGVVAPEDSPLLGLVSLIAPIITSGNTVVALASSSQPYPAIILGEILATSDLPGGVVNLLTGFRKEILSTLATHAHVRAVTGICTPEERKQIRVGSAENVKRVKLLPAEKAQNWFDDKSQGLHVIGDFIEYKTTWHPIGS